MPAPVLNRQQSRLIDRIAISDYEIPGIVLMENAGRGCTDQLLLDHQGGSVVLCCGHGNNGGDGFVIARHLANRGVECKVILFSGSRLVSGDALINLQILRHMVEDNSFLQLIETPANWTDEWLANELSDGTEWIVDGLLGTGAIGAVRSPLDRAIEQINGKSAKRLAIDLPSGMDCDSGKVANVAVRADLTCTFVTLKPAMLIADAADYVGQVKVIDIGVPQRAIQQAVGRPAED